MNNKTVLIAAMLAVATTLTSGLTVLPGSVQEAEANLCFDNLAAQFPDTGDFGDADSDIECEIIAGEIEAEQACTGNEVDHGGTGTAESAGDGESDIECEFTAGSVRLTDEP
jgi:hypothetical protein